MIREAIKTLLMLLILVLLIMTIGDADSATNRTNDVKDKDFLLEVNKGNVRRHSVIHKFGRNSSIGTSLSPVASAGTYKTPTTLVSLEIVSDSVNDAAAGSGARTVIVTGINDTNGAWTEDTETVTMNGTTAVALSKQWRRVYRMRIVTSGTYATDAAPSHNSTITLRESGAGDTWAQINTVGGFGLGSSLIAAYTIPAGKTGIVVGRNIYVDAAKSTDVLFFKREGIDNTSAPYDPMILLQVQDAIGQSVSPNNASGSEVITGPADIGLLARVAAGTGEVSAEFDIMLIEPAGDGTL